MFGGADLLRLSVALFQVCTQTAAAPPTVGGIQSFCPHQQTRGIQAWRETLMLIAQYLH